MDWEARVAFDTHDLHGKYVSPQAHGFCFLRGLVGMTCMVNTWVPVHRQTDFLSSGGPSGRRGEGSTSRRAPRRPSRAESIRSPPREPCWSRPHGRLTCAEGSSDSPWDRRLSPPRAAAPAGGASAPASLESAITSFQGRPGEARPEEPRQIPGAQRRRHRQLSER